MMAVCVRRINAADRAQCQIQPSCRQDDLEAGDELLQTMIRSSEIKANEKFAGEGCPASGAGRAGRSRDRGSGRSGCVWRRG